MSVSPPESGSPSWTEADRLAALRSFHVLDTEPEAAFDEITAAAARICNAPMALVSLVDDVRHWFKCEIGVGEREIPRGIGICGHTILQSGVFVVPDTTKDPRFADNPLVTGKPHLRFYAGAPLVTDDGLPLGTLCVLDDKPRPEGLTPEQSTALLDLARAVMTQLKLRRARKLMRRTRRGSSGSLMPCLISCGRRCPMATMISTISAGTSSQVCLWGQL